MNEKLKQIVINRTDGLVGPTLDWAGSVRANEQTQGNVTFYDLVDRETGQLIGSGFSAVRDGMAQFDTFFESSSLRKKIFMSK